MVHGFFAPRTEPFFLSRAKRSIPGIEHPATLAGTWIEHPATTNIILFE
ncbi:MAG: hypothetical protein AB1847_02880 [bacterium]